MRFNNTHQIFRKRSKEAMSHAEQSRVQYDLVLRSHSDTSQLFTIGHIIFSICTSVSYQKILLTMPGIPLLGLVQTSDLKDVYNICQYAAAIITFPSPQLPPLCCDLQRLQAKLDFICRSLIARSSIKALTKVSISDKEKGTQYPVSYVTNNYQEVTQTFFNLTAMPSLIL